MSQDICLIQDNSTLFDLSINTETKDFQMTEGMETAVNFQLFVDQRVSAEERQNPQDRRGWIGDIQTRQENYQAGSILHLQEQKRDTPVDNNETAALAKNALEYFVQIGAAKEITSQMFGSNIQGTISIDGSNVSRYTRLWKAPLSCQAEPQGIGFATVFNKVTEDLMVKTTDIDETKIIFQIGG